MILLALTLVLVAKAGTVIGVYEDPRTGEASFDVMVTESLSPHLGTFGYFYVSPSWKEGYGGFTLGNEHWQLAAGPGFESGQSFRYGGWIWYGNGDLSVTYAFEGAGSGYWDKYLVQYQTSPSLNLGVMEKRGLGYGGQADLSVGKNSTFRIEYFPKTGQQGGYSQIGLRFNL